MEGAEKQTGQDLDFSMDEILSELESLRNCRKRDAWNKAYFSEQEDKIILAARAGNKPIPWKALAEFLEKKGFGKKSVKSIARRYSELTE